MRTPAMVLALLLLAAPASAQSRPPSLTRVMERVARYVESYGEQMLAVVGTERYVQWFDTIEIGHTQVTRELTSEFALVRAQDDWVGFRDVYEVDGTPVRDRQDRLLRVFSDSPSTAYAEGRRIADESARYNIGTVQRNINTPTMALYFVRATQQERSTFKKSGEERLGGQLVWRISWRETHTPTVIRSPGGANIPASGAFWVDPADGRVCKTHIEVQTTQPGRRSRLSSSVTVTYGLDSRLGLLVPLEMRESYTGMMARPDDVPGAGNEGPMEIGGRATYSDYRRFETSGRVIVPK